MKRFAAILLTLYALSMLSYGSLEMAHDMLHWMATHFHSELHNHEHDHHHHTFHDHKHQHTSHHHHHDLSENDSPENTEFPSLIHFFLYYQQRPSFSFVISYTGILDICNIFPVQYVDTNPSTPPPQIV